MPVTYLELENFKSYAGIQKIGPFQNFTSIIGPNGSGKSNLMDAISFVLGVSSRNLRSSQLKDLIHRPPEEIHDEEEDDNHNDEDNDVSDNDNNDEVNNSRRGKRSTGRGRKASATLVYVDDESNSETRFSRTISSKGVGEYKINNRVVSFTQYEKQLSTIGVMLKGRNFLVFQGDVESTARKTPKELTAWFEEISASSELKEEYDEAFKTMTEAESQVRNMSQKLKVFYKERRELKVQKEEAEKFQSSLNTKAKLLTEFFLWQLFHVKCDIEEKEEVVEEVNQEIKDANEVVAEKTDVLRQEKKEASKSRNSASKLEKERVTLAAEVDKAQPSAIKTQEEIKNLSKKLASEEKKCAKIRAENESREETIEKLECEIKEYSETESQLKKEFEDTKLSRSNARDDATLTEEQEAEYEVVREAAAAASFKPREALNMAKRRLENARAKASTLDDEIKELTAKKQEATNKLKDLIKRKSDLEKSVEKSSTDLKVSENELQNIQRVAQEAVEKRKAIDLELEQLNQKLLEFRDDRRKNQHEARLEEAMSSLKRYFPGVKDRLVKLCQPTQKRFDLAVTVAGGKDMDAVVVDTKQTAADCIQYLRTNQIGTATFLPLDTLQIPNPDSTERIRAMIEHDCRFRLACDVIACDESVKKAVLYAVGNSVVCDDLDSARELCFSRQNRAQKNEEARIKAVTLGGAVISKAGTMTGGISNEERSKAGRWDGREVERLRKRKEELETKLSELDESHNAATQGNRRSSRGSHNYRIEELRNQVGNLKSKLQYSKTDIEFTNKQAKQQETLVVAMTSQIKDAEKKLSNTESQIECAKDEVQKAADDVKQVEAEHFEPFMKKTGLKDFRAYDEAVGKAREEYFKKVTIIREHLEKLRAKKVYEEGRDIEAAISKMQKTIDNIKKKLESAKSREAKIMNSVAESKAKLAEVESKLEQARQDEAEREESVRNAQSEYKAKEKELAKLSKKLNNEEANLERLRSKQQETLQMARVEEAELPLIDSSNAETSSQLSNKIDYSMLRRDLKQRRNDRDALKVQKKFEADLAKLSTQIESMAPNMRAGEAFSSMIDQVDECQEDLTKSKENAREAARKFEDIRRERADRFNNAFEHIADSLSQIYTDMTKSSKHPLGGKAFLNVTDKEEPYNGEIDFSAIPPMKRFRGMESLSGGEKTIAALALLFAIHSFHPAPFFVMDEVDAALDNINVLKLCNYIKQRSDDFQCIVISLKDMFYEKSNSLVGICRDVRSNSSQTLTLDLSKFDVNNNSNDKDKKRRRMSSLGPRKRTASSPQESEQ